MNTILLADDNKSIRELLIEELGRDGYRVVGARHGGELIELIEQNVPDLIILDVRMPELGGLEAIVRIKARVPEVPVIFFAIECQQYRRDRRGRLAKAWIEKREDLSELKQTVARILGRDTNTSAIEGKPGLDDGSAAAMPPVD